MIDDYPQPAGERRDGSHWCWTCRDWVPNTEVRIGPASRSHTAGLGDVLTTYDRAREVHLVMTYRPANAGALLQ